MTTVQKALAAGLLVQTALLAFTWMPTSSGPREPRDLLGFPVEQVTKVVIHGRTARDEKAPSQPVSLSKTDAGWILDSSDGYPASQKYVDPLLETLGKLKVREPIAARPESFSTLEVADEIHTRKLEVTSAAGETRILYLGAAQGQAAHIRVGGESEVFDVKGFTAWTLAENDNRYFERDLLKVEPDQVRQATLSRPGEPMVTFNRDDAGVWTITGLGEGQAVDQAATRNYVGNLLQLRMLQPEGKVEKPEMGFAGGHVVTWTVLENGAEVTHRYELGAAMAVAEGRRYLRLDSTPFVFVANKGNIASAVEKDLATLFQGPVDVPTP